MNQADGVTQRSIPFLSPGFLLRDVTFKLPYWGYIRVPFKGSIRVPLRVNGFSLSYHNKEIRLFTTDPYYGNLN